MMMMMKCRFDFKLPSCLSNFVLFYREMLVVYRLRCREVLAWIERKKHIEKRSGNNNNSNSNNASGANSGKQGQDDIIMLLQSAIHRSIDTEEVVALQHMITAVLTWQKTAQGKIYFYF